MTQIVTSVSSPLGSVSHLGTSCMNNSVGMQLKLSVSRVRNALTVQKSIGIVARHLTGGAAHTARTA
ncbi:MAG TPA: hypothetical protein VHX14_14400 [Thermoanaerobaculia bacterium]|nr:hypothetical protein [Thermoanaerobaculia bacterium]